MQGGFGSRWLRSSQPLIVDVADQQYELFTFEIYGQFGFIVEMFAQCLHRRENLIASRVTLGAVKISII
jgi:hypothetical protein